MGRRSSDREELLGLKALQYLADRRNNHTYSDFKQKVQDAYRDLAPVEGWDSYTDDFVHRGRLTELQAAIAARLSRRGPYWRTLVAENERLRARVKHLEDAYEDAAGHL